MKILRTTLLLLFCLFIGLGLIFWGMASRKEAPKVSVINPTPTATPSATPTPQIIFRNVPNSSPAPTSGQSAQPSGGSSQNGQPQTINNNTTVQQQPNPQPPPAPTQAPQPTPTPGLLPGILDLLL